MARPDDTQGHHARAARSGAGLLACHGPLVDSIRSLVAVPPSHWRSLYNPTLERFAALVQLSPASEAHHHAEPGGLLRHSLETMYEALRLRRGRLLPPGTSAEAAAAHADLWTYAVATAALLHDAGKIVTDLCFVLDGNESWTPLGGPMVPGTRYRVRFARDRVHARHASVTPLLAPLVIPAAGMRWLASDPGLLVLWVAALREEDTTENVLAIIVKQADRRSTALDLGGHAEEASSPAPRSRPKNLAERLITGLRQMLLAGDLPLNAPGAAGFLDGEDLWLVSKRTLDAIREYLHAAGIGGIPQRNDRLMDELQQHGWLTPNGCKAVWRCEIRIGEWSQTLSCLRLPARHIWADAAERPASINGSVRPVATATQESENSEVIETISDNSPPHPCAGENRQSDAEPDACSSKDDAGDRFLSWLKTGLEQRRFQINTPQARIHVLEEGLALVSPGIFQDYAPLDWHRVQRRFQKLKLHAKTPRDENIWTCRVEKDRKRSLIKVFLIPQPVDTLELSIPIPPPNPAVSLVTESESVSTA